MSKKTNEEKEQKRRERLQKHIVTCPHCGKEALDHMTQCPHCGGELTPAGYQPMDEGKRKKIRMITYSVGIVVAIAIAVLIIVFR